ncbi:MAG: permease prefix domain 1-containing protein [Clostridia bacterium]|nr:permease prefix domain 1-containing protein [Clostridia bacterium]
MSTKLRTYVDTLFEEAPTAPHVYDLKEELLANLEEKFEDLLAAGYSEEDAYASVISGLGDAESLIASMSVEPELREIPYEEARRHTAQTVASSAFLYCIAVAAFLLVRLVFGSTLGWVAFWVIAAFATGQVVYHYMTRPIVTDRPRSSKWSKKRRKQIKGSLSGILWVFTTMVYMGISFGSHQWHISWIIFLVATIAQLVLNLAFKLRDGYDE